MCDILGDSQPTDTRCLDGQPAAQVARDLGISRATFYRRSRALTGWALAQPRS
ncbi:helix-turn-helix domain-containing protein [Agromyces humi]|uniref:helix-turn-helix domain-containing protein n=1 Tax=Agromyces humi TaxID=1766800 RepID=UPI0038B23723